MRKFDMSKFKEGADLGRAEVRRKRAILSVYTSVGTGIVLLFLNRNLRAPYLIAMGLAFFLIIPAFSLWRHRKRSP